MKNDKENKSALSVNKGIEQPPAISNESISRFKKIQRRKMTVSDYVNGILSGNRTLLGQAITLIESALPEHQQSAREIISQCIRYSGKSVRIGITGVPGVGKSTFIESLGKSLTNAGNKLAVLAIDPSSEISKGSILGDKTRMEELSADSNAFIRPSPSGGTLGGVARKTRETILLCEAAGYNVIFIETVGVGQSETAVHSMTDFFLLLMLAGAGDELQGIKRGIMEMADALVITKADGTNAKKAVVAKAQYENALHYFPPRESEWVPRVLTCSSINNIGINEIWRIIEDYRKYTIANKYFDKRRVEQSKYWMYETINEGLQEKFYQHPDIKSKIIQLEKQLIAGEISSFYAANLLLETYFKNLK